MKSKSTIIKLLLLFFIIIIIGTAGYIIIEGYSFIDALFMTIITISTVGYGTIKELSTGGIAFTILLIMSSLITVGLIAHNFSQYILDGEFSRNLQLRKRKRLMKNKINHIIICGFGRNGSHAAMELITNNKEVVVIDNIEKTVSYGQDRYKNVVFISGDARDEETLAKANIATAKAIITTLPEDADNLFVVITARQMNPKIKIISRASEDSTESKLRHAGANYVILPDSVGGTRMGKLVFQKDVIEFLEELMIKSGKAVNITQINCDELPEKFIGKSLLDLDIRKNSGANIIGMKLQDGSFVFNPDAYSRIEKNSKLFVLGNPEQVNTLKKIMRKNKDN